MKKMLFLLLLLPGVINAQKNEISQYNIVWNAPSSDATGSMPLSGHNLGLNVWVEGDDILFYIGRPDSHRENGELIKLGRIRITLHPSPLKKNFRQELDLVKGCINISGETKNNQPVQLKLWADAFQPVVHVEMQSKQALTATVAYESWRINASHKNKGLEWCYRLPAIDSVRVKMIAHQKAESFADAIPDPLSNLCIGGRLIADGFEPDGTAEGQYMSTPYRSWKIKSRKPVSSFDMRILLRVEQDATAKEWNNGLNNLEQKTSTTAKNDFAKTVNWWKTFWDRSYIIINPDRINSEGWQIGRNYQLFRYMLAANRSSKYPTLFNGGIFTFDNPLEKNSPWKDANQGNHPDYRVWWDCFFMAQNQRLIYWPLLKSGDEDILNTGLDFYRNTTSLAQKRVKHYFGIEGVQYTESVNIYGMPGIGADTNGLCSFKHLTYHFTSMLDYAFMMQEQCRYNNIFFQRSLPMMMGVLKFYDSFYKKEYQKKTGSALNEQEKLVLYPSCGIELYQGATNPTDVLAGLTAISEGLLNNFETLLPQKEREWLVAFKKRIPTIKTEEKKGKTVMKVADSFESASTWSNMEISQLYAVFPFNQYGVGKPELEMARNSWILEDRSPNQKGSFCWYQNGIFTARMGMTNEAKDFAVKKFLFPVPEGRVVSPSYGEVTQFIPRFPAFWSTFPFCHAPDMDHGGTAMVGLQEMLMQTTDDRIFILPAWPKDWDVKFKLHAPKNTTVECEYRNGRVEKKMVSPVGRTKDLVPFTTIGTYP